MPQPLLDELVEAQVISPSSSMSTTRPPPPGPRRRAISRVSMSCLQRCEGAATEWLALCSQSRTPTTGRYSPVKMYKERARP